MLVTLPRTPRGARATTDFSLPLHQWISYPPYPNSITDTNPVVLGRPYGSVDELDLVFADIGQTTTWNLMIDPISQYGHFTTGATNASQFIVEGEQHYWMSIAIDRRTGAIVVDRQSATRSSPRVAVQEETHCFIQ